LQFTKTLNYMKRLSLLIQPRNQYLQTTTRIQKLAMKKTTLAFLRLTKTRYGIWKKVVALWIRLDTTGQLFGSVELFNEMFRNILRYWSHRKKSHPEALGRTVDDFFEYTIPTQSIPRPFTPPPPPKCPKIKPLSNTTFPYFNRKHTVINEKDTPIASNNNIRISVGKVDTCRCSILRVDETNPTRYPSLRYMQNRTGTTENLLQSVYIFRIA